MEFNLDWPVLRKRLRNLFALVGLAVFFDRILLALQELFTKEFEDNSIDYVLVFSAVNDGKTDEEKLRRTNEKRLILAGIVQSGLSVEQIDDTFWNSHHKKDDDLQLDEDARVTVYAVTATFETLIKGAELFRVRKAVRVIMTSTSTLMTLNVTCAAWRQACVQGVGGAQVRRLQRGA